MVFAAIAITTFAAAIARTGVRAFTDFFVALVAGVFFYYFVATDITQPVTTPSALFSSFLVFIVFTKLRCITVFMMRVCKSFVVLWVSV